MAKTKKTTGIKWNKFKSRKGAEDCPEGKFDFVISSAKVDKTSTGKKKISLGIRVANGEHKGSTAPLTILIESDTDIEFAKGVFESMGAKKFMKSDNIEDLVGVEFNARLTYQYGGEDADGNKMKWSRLKQIKPGFDTDSSKSESFDPDLVDYDIDTIKTMKRRELEEIIDEEELDLDSEDFDSVKDLRSAVIDELGLNEDGEEDEEEEEEEDEDEDEEEDEDEDEEEDEDEDEDEKPAPRKKRSKK